MTSEQKIFLRVNVCFLCRQGCFVYVRSKTSDFSSVLKTYEGTKLYILLKRKTTVPSGMCILFFVILKELQNTVTPSPSTTPRVRGSGAGGGGGWGSILNVITYFLRDVVPYL